MAKTELKDVFHACYLHSMYQELIPLGVDPIKTFEDHCAYLTTLENDQSTFRLNHTFKTTINKPSTLPERGTLFVSVHFSKYFSAIPFAFLNQIFYRRKLLLIMRKKTREQQPQWKQKIYQAAEDKLGMTILYAEDKNTALRVVRALKKGINVLTYVDANFGSTGPSSSTQTIDFLTHPIDVPTGIFKLAQIADANVIPVYACGNEPDSMLSFGKEYNLKDETFEKDIQNMFTQFAKVILGVPSQWSQWGFLYDNTQQMLYSEIDNYTSTKNEYIEHEGSNYVFDFGRGFLDTA